MKTLIVLVLGLIAVGCGNIAKKKVIGEYEYVDAQTLKEVFLDNGVSETYRNGKKASESKWSIVDGEIHAKSDSGAINIWRKNTDKSITSIARIRDGKRTDFPKEEQNTLKKIK